MEDESFDTIRGRELLPGLADNIKCGNSLIGTDILDMDILPAVGTKERTDELERIRPFDWENEFPRVFTSEKDSRPLLKAYHVTWVTHNSRVSERMVQFGVRRGEPFIFKENQRNDVYNYLVGKILKEGYKILALNVLDDHVHCIVVCEENELDEIVRNLKGYSSYSLSRQLKLSVDSKGRQSKIWAKGYSHTYIDTDEHLQNGIIYINENHKKHGLAPIDRQPMGRQLLDRQLKQSVDNDISGVPVNRGLQPSAISTIDEAFTSQLSDGFDAVIGNPPYGALFGKLDKKYVNKEYSAADIETESYLVFIEKSITLLKFNGFFGYIVPSNLMTNVRYEAIRDFLLKNYNINKLVDLGSGVFNKTSVDTCLIFIQKKKAKDNKITAVVGNIGDGDIQTFIFNQSDFIINPYKIFNIYTEPKVLDLIDKIFQSMPHLSDFVIISRGIEFGYKSKFVSDEKLNKQFKPLIAGRCITRYSLEFENKYICFDEKDISHFKEQSIYITPKILMRRIGTTIIATYDPERYYNVCDVYNIINKSSMSIQYLLGLLNSMLLSFILQNRFKTSKKLFPKIPIITIKNLPIRTIDFSNPDDVKKHDHMVKLVEDMLALHKQLHKEKSKSRKKIIQDDIDHLDKKIDALVYELYGLTEEEIRVVEGEKN